MISLVAKSPQIWLALGSRAVPPARLPHELGPAVALVRVAKRRNGAEVAVAPDSAEGFYVVERALHEIVDMRARAGRCQSDGERGPEGGQRVVALLARQALAVGPVLLDPRKQAPELGQVVRLEEARAVRPRIHFSSLFLQKVGTRLKSTSWRSLARIISSVSAAITGARGLPVSCSGSLSSFRGL